MDEHLTAGSPHGRVAGSAAAARRVDRRAPAVIGLDVGTGALKALLADAGGPRRSIRRGYRLDMGADGRVEVDAERVWRSARTAIRALAADAAAGGLRVVAICAGGSGDEAVWLDDGARPVAPVPMALDGRAASDRRRLIDAVGLETFMATTGLPPSGADPLQRLLWLRRTAPKRAERVRRLLAWPEFLALRLGVEPVAEPTLAARSAAFDVARGAWSSALLAAAGVELDLFPPIAPTGSVVGTVPATIADALGLPSGVRVVAGGFDQAMATLGAGIAEPGTGHLGAGSWEALTILRPGPSAELVPLGFSVGPAIAARGAWSAMASWPGAIALGWVGGLAALDRPSRARGGADVRRALAVARAARDEPTDVLVLPDFDGSTAAGSAAAAIAALRIDVDAPILGRAMLQGITFAGAHHLDTIRQAGDHVDEIRVTGGGTLDPCWLQVRADVLRARIVPVDPPDTGTAAAAALAWGAVVGDRSIAELIRTLVRTRRPIEPRPAIAERYERMRARWQALRAAITAASKLAETAPSEVTWTD
jgi:sugar (pentulose or hexulose) kinase